MIEYLVLGGAALGAVGWEHLRRRRHARQYQAFLSTLSTEAQVVLHVANHEATQRRQALAPMHLAYGLLQDEGFIEAVRSLGGDPEAIEARVLAELDKGVMDILVGDVPEAVIAVAHAAAMAQQAGRVATCGDLYGHLARTSAAHYFDAPPLDPHALLFLVVHGEKLPPATVETRDAFVVIRNDDFTLAAFVVELLAEVFGLADAEARRVMQEANDTGRAIVGRYPRDEAHDKLVAARTRARDAASPLWIGVEPA